MARTRTGLTDDDVVTLRAALEGNRRPRVSLPAQQFGGATTGQIVAVGDPEVEGSEFIAVRVKLDGITDTVRFSPGELTLPSRTSNTAKNGTTRAAANGAASTTSTSPSSTATPPPATPPSPENPAFATSVTRGTKRSPSARRGPASLTITLISSGSNWSLAATRSGRAVVKATPVPAGVITAAADLLAEPALIAAVDDVNGWALREAQERATQLRSELAALELLLESHRRPG